jgi:hypothetical protein
MIYKEQHPFDGISGYQDIGIKKNVAALKGEEEEENHVPFQGDIGQEAGRRARYCLQGQGLRA